MIAWGMITAPRPVSTLDQSLASFKAAGFDEEPIVVNDNKGLGNLRNWARALVTVMAGNPHSLFVGIMQDDILWARNSRAVLYREIIDMGYRAKEAGYLSLYLFDKHVEEREMKIPKWRNWHASKWGYKSCGAQCYVLPRRSAKQLLRYPRFQELCEEGALGDDHAVSGCFWQMNLLCWFRIPALVSHSPGVNNSSMGHKPPPDTQYWNEVARLYA